MQVVSNVRALFARRNVSAARVAQSVGWSQPYMSRRMSGRTPFDVNDLDTLAAAFDVPITRFFALDPDNTPTGGTTRPKVLADHATVGASVLVGPWRHINDDVARMGDADRVTLPVHAA